MDAGNTGQIMNMGGSGPAEKLRDECGSGQAPCQERRPEVITCHGCTMSTSGGSAESDSPSMGS